MKMRIFGDIHGDTRCYKPDTEKCDISVQIGDFGYGFSSRFDEISNIWFAENPNHKFIRGNHDSYQECKKSPGFIDDGYFDEENSILYIGGAWSIDWQGRTPGVSWWEDEEVSEKRFEEILEFARKEKPKIIISHEGPNNAVYPMFISSGKSLFNCGLIETRTGRFITEISKVSECKLHIFGHWHINSCIETPDTTYVCVGEQEYIDLDTETLDFSFRNS